MRFISICLTFVLATTQSFARPLTTHEYITLSAVVEKYSNDMKELNFSAVIDTMPNRIAHHLSVKLETSPEQVRRIISEQTHKIMRRTIIQVFEADLSDLDLTDARNIDGTPASYTVIPYDMLMTINGKVHSEISVLLAIYEANQWWLLRFNPDNPDLLLELYPFLKNAKLND